MHSVKGNYDIWEILQHTLNGKSFKRDEEMTKFCDDKNGYVKQEFEFENGNADRHLRCCRNASSWSTRFDVSDG